MNLEGRLLGNRYEIIEKIGVGGMATVYKAKCHVLNRYVAVKILKDEFITDDEFIKRFNTEAQAVASLTHPNIVSVYDVGHEGDLYYIVMELIQGQTLKEIIQTDGALNWKWSLNIAMQIASALETAHKNNIIHRDIKPHNIIITEDGIAKVTDFGIAKSVSNSTITAFGTTLGSVHYFSPEHARGGFTDAKSDLYSLGVVLYEMLTGRVPFEADTPVSVALKHIQEQPKEPINLNPAIPLAANKIVMKAMQKDPNLRYQSASEMLKDLTLAIKNPDGDFINVVSADEDFPTQVIPTIDNEDIEEKIKEKDKQNKKENFFQKHKAFTVILILVILFAVSLGGTSLFFKLTRNKDVQVPNLVGLTKDEINAKIEGTKLTVEIIEEKYDAEIAKDVIISQNPEYKTDYKIKENTKIEIVVSKGQKTTKVPKVTAMKEEDAKKLLEEAELDYEIEDEYNKKIEEGYVISQEIAPDTELPAGSKVKIKVSKGMEMTIVPNVVGKPKDDAIKELTEAGLTVSTTLTEEDTTKEDGTVLKLGIDAGTSVEKGSTLTITVNQIQKIINATATINLKSVLGYTPTYTNSGTNSNTQNNTGSTNTMVEVPPKTVKVKLVVGNDTVYEENHKENETNIKINNISGIGTIQVKLYVDGNLKGGTKQVNLNKETNIVFE